MITNQDQQPLAPLSDQWESIQNHRIEISDELGLMARELPGAARKHLTLLSNWFAYPAKLDEALRRPDVLAICLSLNPSGEGNLSKSEIARAARAGFGLVGQKVSVSRQLTRLLLYPALVLLAVVLLWIGFSVGIAPEFFEMYEEFGIELPAVTKAVFRIAAFIRHWWWAILLFPIGAAIQFWIMSQEGIGDRPPGVSLIDQQMMSRRNALASWAWHVALLLQAGSHESNAIEIAGSITGNSWLSNVCERNIKFLYSDESNHAFDIESFTIDRHGFEFLESAMRLPVSNGKIAMLKEVANYYWDRSGRVGDWWIQLVLTLLLWCVGFLVVVTVFALFAPMMAIVSGLTGK